MTLRVAYLVNQYPKVSHSFIRREILALEASGLTVSRFALRSQGSELVDAADQQELTKTRFILGGGIAQRLGRLLAGSIKVAVSRPRSFLQALQLALRCSWRSDRGVLLHLAYLAEACVLWNWLAEENILHIHAHFGTNSTTVAMLCSALGKVSYSFTVHGPEEFDKVQAIALPEKINRAAFVVAISSYCKSQLYRWCSLKQWSKIHVVRCGIDDSFLAQTPVPIPDQPRFVCIGRLTEQKGQFLLIEAAKQLVNEGFQFKLVLIGDGELREAIESSIQAAGLENTIELFGWANSDTIRQELLASRAMVLPSFAEGLPVVLMESLALHRPVITTHINGIPELVRSGISGWLVPPGDLDELTAAMREALQCPTAQLEQMGLAGANRTAQQHNITTEAKKLAGLLTGATNYVPPAVDASSSLPDPTAATLTESRL